MIRRNFFKIACGAIAALFVPKVAGAVVRETSPLGCIAKGRQLGNTNTTLYFLGKDRLHVLPPEEDIIEAIKQQRAAAMESLAKGWEDYLWGPKLSTRNIRTIATADGRMRAGTMT